MLLRRFGTSVLRPGDHIKVRRSLHSHHAIYIGHGEVIHLHGPRAKKEDCEVRIDSLVKFSRGDPVKVVLYGPGEVFAPEVVLARARRQLGRKGYDLLTGNCEHFVRECKTGKPKSYQVRTAATFLGAALGIGLALSSKK